MTPEELVEALQRYRDKAAAAMPEVAMAMADTVEPKVTVGLLIVSVPSAPATAEPIVTLVIEPDNPAVPRFTALVTPLVVAPVPMPRVEAAAELPTVTLVAEKVVVF